MERLPFDPSRAVGAERLGAKASARAARSTASRALSVSQLTRLVADVLGDNLPPTLYVSGEISNFKRHSSGHLYFTLKDDHCELSCVMWRSVAARLKFKPEDGLDVVLSGHVDVFERAGRYQFYARSMAPLGAGALELAFRRLCDKLHREGLFEQSAKKPIPRLPRTVAVVTSATGAAVRDITTTLGRRYPLAGVLICPVTVQGPAAAGEIAAAIRHLNHEAESLGGVDVIICGRGGGSIEDLWAFNEEIVARAIHASRIPIISAVGHESDLTIADLVADVRAATPTGAAELAAPDIAELTDELAHRRGQLDRGLRHALKLAESHLRRITQHPVISNPTSVIEPRRRRVHDLARDLDHHHRERIRRWHRRVEHAQVLLGRIQPHQALGQAMQRWINARHQLRFALHTRLARLRTGVQIAGQHLVSVADPRRTIEPRRQACGALSSRMDRAANGCIQRWTALLHTHRARLAALDYQTTLERGFSITCTAKDARIVRRTSDLADGDRIITRLADGEVHSRVEEPSPQERSD